MAKRKTARPAPAETYLERPVRVPKPQTTPRRPKTHLVEDGDSYALLAAQYPKPGKTKHQRATELFHINDARKLIPGTLIRL
jgi:hypothetical protein